MAKFAPGQLLKVVAGKHAGKSAEYRKQGTTEGWELVRIAGEIVRLKTTSLETLH